MNIEPMFEKELKALREAVTLIPADKWKQGLNEYLIPARLYYHIFIGLEWFINTKDPEEHKRTRKYNLNWMDTVDPMPDQPTALKDIDWLEDRIKDRIATAAQSGEDLSSKAVYFVRHTRHHFGELAAVMRLLGIKRPKWE
ncbi:MAG: hypothetical protein ACE14V_01940 [bacterium]